MPPTDPTIEVQKARLRGVTDPAELENIRLEALQKQYWEQIEERRPPPPPPPKLKPGRPPKIAPPQPVEVQEPKALKHYEPDLSPKQRQVIEAVRDPCGHRKFIFINGPKWTGKCLSKDAIVYTTDGLALLGEMGSAPTGAFDAISRDVVSMPKDGLDVSTARADQFYNSGFKDAIQIQTQMGYEIVCSENHPVWTESDGEIKYRTAVEISTIFEKGGEVWFPLMRGHPLDWDRETQKVNFEWTAGQESASVSASNRVSEAHRRGARSITELIKSSGTTHHTVHKWLNSPSLARSAIVEIDEEVAYLMGLLTGDGCYTKTTMANCRIGYSGKDAEINDAVKRIVESFPESRFKHDKGCNHSIYSAFLRKFLREVGMAGKYAQEKTVPSVIINSPKRVIVAFLQGLFDTDGTVGKGGDSSYCSASPVLAKQVQDLLLALGVRSSRTFKKNKCLGAWIIATREEDGFREKVGFRLSRKQNRKYFRDRKWKVSWAAYPPSFRGVLEKLHATRKKRGVGTLPRKIHKYAINPVLRGQRTLSMKMVAPLAKLINCENEPEFQSYWMHGRIWWDKIERCSKTKSELVDLCVPVTNSFIGNGFINHNSVGCEEAVIDYLWNVKDATVCVLAASIGAGDDCGIWTELMKRVQIHVDAGYGFDWWNEPNKKRVMGAKMKGASKKIYAEVKNRHGGKSYLELNSLKDERDVEKLFFNRYFSFIYWSELQNSRLRTTFDTLCQSLRISTVAEDDHVLLADGNPSDEGTRSWQYKLFFEFRISDEVPDSQKPLQHNLKLIQIFLSDNPYLTEDRKKEIAAGYEHNPDLYARYVKGEWVNSTVGALFADVFLPNVHLVGNPKEEDPEILIPMDGCSELITGWDTGESNPFSYIVEPVVLHLNEKPVTFFRYLDELAFLGEEITVESFTLLFMEKMKFWESIIGHEIVWRHWADKSALDRKESISQRTVADEVFNVSDGTIQLQGVEKGKGSVAQRIRLWRKLLIQKRILISAAKCPKLHESCQMLKQGKFPGSIASHTPYKHPFDAATYPLMKELWDELQANIMAIRTMRNGNVYGQETDLVLVKL